VSPFQYHRLNIAPSPYSKTLLPQKDGTRYAFLHRARYRWRNSHQTFILSLSDTRNEPVNAVRLEPARKDEIQPDGYVPINQSYMETMIDGGYLLRKAVRTGNTDNRKIKNNPSDEDDEFSEYDYYAGYLVQLNENSPQQSIEDTDNNKWTSEAVVCEAQISSFHSHSDIELSMHSRRYHAACQVLDTLFHHFLLLEKEEGDTIWTYFLHLSGDCSLLRKAAHDRGFFLIEDKLIEDELTSHGEEGDSTTTCVMKWGDPFRTLRCMTEYAFSLRGTSGGLTALEILGMISERRVPFHFEGLSNIDNKHDSSIREETNIPHLKENKGRSSILKPSRQIIPNDTLDELQFLLDVIKRNGWLSTNLDSVDNLPSLHLNLVTNGKPKFDEEDHEKISTSIDEITGYDFRTCVCKILGFIRPHLYGKLLSRAQRYTNSSGVEISEIFVRSYGEDLQPPQFGAASRNGISAHYDVLSSLTAVIALDDVASEGKSGLYTFYNRNPSDSDHRYTSTVSKHPSLRRYFPLEAGDGVLHSWDVLHGVDIEPTLERTSLVVWFTDYGENDEDINSMTPPWLENPYDQDDVGNFVLATAIESADGENGPEESTILSVDSYDNEQQISPSDATIRESITEGTPTRDERYRRHFNSHDLYLKSASLGNAFGLSRLGSLCNDETLCRSSPSLIQLRDMLCNLNSESQNLRSRNDFLDYILEERGNGFRATAKGLWFEAAMRGDLSAQSSLAAACMEDFMSSHTSKGDVSVEQNDPSRNQDEILIAAVLFAMAAQQGDEGSFEALSRVMNIHRSYFTSDSDQELFDDDVFLNSPISKTIMVGANLV